MQISSQPYLKTYTFPLLSIAALSKLALLVIAIALPFFLTYSTPSTPLPTRLLPRLAPRHSSHAAHHLQLQVPPRSRHFRLHLPLHQPLQLRLLPRRRHRGTLRPSQQSDSSGVLTFRLKWSKANTAERVVRVQIALFFNYYASGTTQLGMATGSVSSYSIADGSIAGVLTIERGTGQGAITESSSHSSIQI
jgi:hypothetical protein